MEKQKRLELVKRNTQEIITEEELAKVLDKKQPVLYLGTAITGTPHIGYFAWVTKMADFIKAGIKCKVLLADIHGALDNTPWDKLEKRYEYYSKIIPLMFESIGADLTKLEIVKGSDFQLKKDYMFDVLKMSTFTSVRDCNKAASEVVKMGDSPKLSGLIYPIMQSLDEVYLKADIQYGGNDQRKILVFARENLPKVGYEPRVEILSPLIPGLTESGKMSASEEGSKIDLLDDEKTVQKKINNAFAEPGNIKNGLLAFAKYVIMVHKEDKREKLIIERPEKFGGNAEYSTYAELEKDYADKKLHPMDLKKAIAVEINKLLDPIRKNKTKLEKIRAEVYK